MAEGFARAWAPEGSEVRSAGTHPAGIHPVTIEVMAEIGIDVSGQTSDGLADLPVEEVDHFVTLCSHAESHCPTLPGHMTREHWPLPDPAAAAGPGGTIETGFRLVRDDIAARVAALFAVDNPLDPAEG